MFKKKTTTKKHGHPQTLPVKIKLLLSTLECIRSVFQESAYLRSVWALQCPARDQAVATGDPSWHSKNLKTFGSGSSSLFFFFFFAHLRSSRQLRRVAVFFFFVFFGSFVFLTLVRTRRFFLFLQDRKKRKKKKTTRS